MYKSKTIPSWSFSGTLHGFRSQHLIARDVGTRRMLDGYIY